MKIGKEMISNTKNKTKDRKNRNTIMHKDNKEASTNQARTRDEEETDKGTRKGRDRKKKKEMQKTQNGSK